MQFKQKRRPVLLVLIASERGGALGQLWKSWGLVAHAELTGWMNHLF